MADPKIKKAFEVISKGIDPSKMPNMPGAGAGAPGGESAPSEPKQAPPQEEKKPEPPK